MTKCSSCPWLRVRRWPTWLTEREFLFYFRKCRAIKKFSSSNPHPYPSIQMHHSIALDIHHICFKCKQKQNRNEQKAKMNRESKPF